MTWADIADAAQKHGLGAILTAMTGVGTWAYRTLSKRLRKEREENKASRNATRALLADRMIQQYNYRVDQGYCPIYARQSMEDMFTAYKALGGNGTIEDIYRKLKDLPTEKPKEENKDD